MGHGSAVIMYKVGQVDGEQRDMISSEPSRIGGLKKAILLFIQRYDGPSWKECFEKHSNIHETRENNVGGTIQVFFKLFNYIYLIYYNLKTTKV